MPAKVDAVCDIAGAFTVVTRAATPADLKALARDVGPPEPVTRDVTMDEVARSGARLEVRFVDDLRAEPLHVLDGGRVGYSDGSVYVLDRTGSRPVARLTQDVRWGTGTVVCRRGVSRVPALAGASDLAALSAGWIPLHAAAWRTAEGVGVVASGWQRSGKSGALLVACENGATPIGDDRVWISRDGTAVAGLGRPVEVKDWHLAQLRLPGLVTSGRRRMVARAAHALDGVLDRSARRGHGWAHPADRALDRVRSRSRVEIDVARLGRLDDPRPRTRPHVVLLLETHTRESVKVEPADPALVSWRLAAHLGVELLPALRVQLAYDYVHPDEGWQGVARAPAVARGLLEEAVRRIPAWTVRYPYPCPLHELDAAVSKIVRHLPVR